MVGFGSGFGNDFANPGAAAAYDPNNPEYQDSTPASGPIDVGGAATDTNPVVSAPSAPTATGVGGSIYDVGIPQALASGANQIGGAIGGSIGAGFETLGNYISEQEDTAIKTAANWLGRIAFFIVGLILIIIGLNAIVSKSQTVQSAVRTGVKILK